MTVGGVSRPGGTDGAVETLSTGHRVELPLSTTARARGVVLPASRSGVRSILPESLRPVRVTPTRAAVTFLSVAYDRIGGSDIDPYDEFGVLFPAVPADAPPVSAIRRVGGYVDFLPVTTEPARALGVEVWGYPKAVADITHRERGATRRTTVTVDGEGFVALSVDRPPTVETCLSSASYTTMDGRLLRERLTVDGRVGAWPASGAFSVTLGDHPRADRLRRLDVGDRAILRVAADVEFTIHAGRRVGSE
ncbi:acetoacetate decarboxylase family protein [Haloplanus rubicundus]|uniref:acetoacetate decarboxylase family protein n=1 Tax=Haloplanus rubicundus TaxID=1547898 RepID=UPI001C9E74E9|nr:acetoacetate decarboxylase family protein [Haloplanus rubicundus]